MQYNWSKIKKGGIDALYVFTTVVIVLFIALALFRVFIGINYFGVNVIGDSMEGTLFDGDFVYAFRSSSTRRGDIVVLPGKDKLIIKRVIAIGGDTVELKRGALYLNGEEVDEPYVLSENNSPDMDKNTFGPKIVEDGQIFFMGDNRNDSNDSRNETEYGTLSVEEIVGVVADWSVKYKNAVTFCARFGL